MPVSIIFFRILIATFIILLINDGFFNAYYPGNLFYLLIAAYLTCWPTRGSVIRQNFFLLCILLFSILLLQFLFMQSLHDRALDIVIGVFVGTMCQLLWPINLAAEFSKSMRLVLQELAEYLRVQIIFCTENNAEHLLEKKIALEKLLLSGWKIYPEWIYQRGFNPGLRAGFRFFLVHVDQIIELLIVNDEQLRREQPPIAKHLQAKMVQAMEGNHQLLMLLMNYFEHKKLSETQTDFAEDINNLEQELWQILPNNLELLDLSPHFLLLIALVRNIKDIRNGLLKLISALPKSG